MKEAIKRAAKAGRAQAYRELQVIGAAIMILIMAQMLLASFAGYIFSREYYSTATINEA